MTKPAQKMLNQRMVVDMPAIGPQTHDTIPVRLRSGPRPSAPPRPDRAVDGPALRRPPRTPRQCEETPALGLAGICPAEIPDSELERLADLQSLGALELHPSKHYQRFVRLAAEICDTPMASISFLDRHREWFLAELGLGVRELPRDFALPAYTLFSRRHVVIRDLTDDDRFVASPLVCKAPGVRALASVVLRGPAGQPVGAFSVYDPEPRDFEPGVLAQFAQLGRLLEEELQERVLSQRSRTQPVAHNFDTVTGLASLRTFKERLGQAIHWASGLDKRVAVVRIDVNRFKALRRQVGDGATDNVLAEIGRRLVDAAGPSGHVVRWQEHEFAAWVPELEEKADAAAIASRFSAAFSKPVEVDGSPFRLTAAVGAAVYPDDGTSPAKLMDNAAAAQAAGRAKGGASARVVRVFTESIQKAMSRDFAIESRLHHALDKDAFTLVYQPKVDAITGDVVGVEALLRWTDELLGFVSPGEFIPVAERSDLIIDIGDWVLRQACHQARRWASAGHRLEVSVNVAGRQLAQPDFADKVATALLVSELDPSLLCLEVTESSLVEDTEALIDKMEHIVSLGPTFSIDDFGTGYSSLRYLRKMPIKQLKIDRVFVNDIVTNDNDAALVHLIIGMARSLNLDVVAEGIETEEQALFLRAYRCNQFQGYLYGKPMPPEALIAMAGWTHGDAE